MKDFCFYDLNNLSDVKVSFLLDKMKIKYKITHLLNIANF
jgi:hypothetical protein